MIINHSYDWQDPYFKYSSEHNCYNFETFSITFNTLIKDLSTYFLQMKEFY